MTIDDKNEIYWMVQRELCKSTTNVYALAITDTIIDKVIEDVETSADEEFNDDDVRLGIGRALLDMIKR